MALTDTEIKGAKPGEKPYKLYDRDGLFALIKPSGSKLWRFKYTFQGKEKLMALGEYPLVRLADARERAFKARKLLADGIDPMGERKAARIEVEARAVQEQRNAETTFKAVALKWHEHWCAGDDVNSDTAGYILRRLEADVFAAFGSKPIDEITPREIRELIQAIGKRARDVAGRQLGTINQIFRYALTHDLAKNNPAAFKPSDILPSRKTQNRAHIEPSRLPALLVAIDEYNSKLLVRYALKLMALTFVRTSELLEAPWREFDLDNSRWVITPERMKMDKPHIVPLSRQAVEVLRELKRLAGDKEFVFPGLNKQTENKTINCNSLLNALDDLGYKGVMTGHGFRGLARTILAENGFDKAHVELQLSHSNDDKVEAAYNHAQYLPQRAELMQWWADYLDSELEKGRAQRVPIRQSAA
jgi:integrase